VDAACCCRNRMSTETDRNKCAHWLLKESAAHSNVATLSTVKQPLDENQNED